MIDKIEVNEVIYKIQDTETRKKLENKQDKLLSGENIKTINNQSLLGEGNINIEISSGGTTKHNELENLNYANSGHIGFASSDDINSINSKIPSQASRTNQLADKDFVNSSISTATAEFKGTYTDLQSLQSVEGNINDYAFYDHADSEGNRIFDRYKYVGIPDSELPDGYTEVDCIKKMKNSQPYINTRLKNLDNLTIKLVVKGSGTYTTPVFGAYESYRIMFGYYSIDRLDVWIGSKSNNTPYTQNEKHIIQVGPTNIYVDGELKFSLPYVSSDSDLYLFASNNSGTPDTFNSEINIYSFEAIRNNETIMKLIPCYRNVDNVVGMYDIIGNEFYTSENEFAFNKENLSVDKWAYEYSLNNSSFTSEQWSTINSGVTSNISSLINDKKYLTLETLPIYESEVE